MIRDYVEYVARRWNELGIPAQTKALADTGITDEAPYKAFQVRALALIIAELRHTTAHEGRRHPDVGLLFKNWGNWFDLDGLGIATDIMCVRDTDSGGAIVDPRAFAIVDCLVAVGSKDTRPAWQVHGLAEGTDVDRWREAPGGPTVEIETHKYMGGGNDTGTCDVAGCGRSRTDPVHRVPEGKVQGHTPWLGEDGKGECDLCGRAVDDPIHRPADHGTEPGTEPGGTGGGIEVTPETLVLLRKMLASQERQEVALAGLGVKIDQLRTEVATAARTVGTDLVKAITSGGIGGLFGRRTTHEVMPGERTPRRDVSSLRALSTESLPRLPEGFDREDDWRTTIGVRLAGMRPAGVVEKTGDDGQGDTAQGASKETDPNS